MHAKEHENRGGRRAGLPAGVLAIVMMLAMGSVAAENRRPAVAGAFYPSGDSALEKEVAVYLGKATVTPPAGRIVAAIAPHAGYRYSASVAAHTWALLRDRIKVDTMVIIGHDTHASGIVAIVGDEDTWETPLGRVDVDTEMVERLARTRGVIARSDVLRKDHTVEVQLPFLQAAGLDCKIVPVMFGDPTIEHARTFARAIRAAAGDKRVFVLASTDLSHYPTYTDAVKIDRETMDKVVSFDAAAVITHVSGAGTDPAMPNLQTAMCASGGVATAMLVAQQMGADAAHILKTANSGDVPGSDRTRVVGYAAAVFTAPEQEEDGAAEAPAEKPAGQADEAGTTPEPDDTDVFTLPEKVQAELLALARKRIETTVRGEQFPYRPPPNMRELLPQAAVFVTLHKAGRLRGCLGTTVPRVELWRAVFDMAAAAATRDPRFKPVAEDELPDLHIEISVLSPMRRIDSHEAIRPKVHGVVVEKGFRKGLFLPQVWDQLPDKEQFLSILCQQKAKLPAAAWRDGSADLSVFTVFAFEEGTRP